MLNAIITATIRFRKETIIAFGRFLNRHLTGSHGKLLKIVRFHCSQADREAEASTEAKIKEIEAERVKKQQEYIDATFEKEIAKLPEDVGQPFEMLTLLLKDRTEEQKALIKKYPSTVVTPETFICLIARPLKT